MGANTLAIARLVSKDTPKTPDAEYADEESLKNLKKELDSRDMNLVIDLPANYLTKNGKVYFEFIFKILNNFFYFYYYY